MAALSPYAMSSPAHSEASERRHGLAPQILQQHIIRQCVPEQLNQLPVDIPHTRSQLARKLLYASTARRSVALERTKQVVQGTYRSM